MPHVKKNFYKPWNFFVFMGANWGYEKRSRQPPSACRPDGERKCTARFRVTPELKSACPGSARPLPESVPPTLDAQALPSRQRSGIRHITTYERKSFISHNLSHLLLQIATYERSSDDAEYRVLSAVEKTPDHKLAASSSASEGFIRLDLPHRKSFINCNLQQKMLHMERYERLSCINRDPPHRTKP